MNLGNDKGEEKPALEQYGVDLTLKARDGKLDPVIGRDSVCIFLYKFGTCTLLSRHGLRLKMLF